MPNASLTIDGTEVVSKADGVIALKNINLDQTWTYRTAQTTTSGTEFDFTSIPSGTSEINVVMQGISLTGTDHLLVQIGDSEGFETTGYVSAGTYQVTGNATSGGGTYSTAGFVVHLGIGTSLLYINYKINRASANGTLWTANFDGALSTTAGGSGGGIKELSSELTQLRVTRTGSDTFDAGSVFVFYR